MKRLILKPDGWPCTLRECPPGHFLFDNEHVGFKSDYHLDQSHELRCGTQAYNSAGEYYCAGDDSIVQPLLFEWEDHESDD